MATRITVVDALAAAPPALSTLPSQTQADSGITVLVRRIEFAASETRVFLRVTNESNVEASVYTYSMKIVQAGTQVDNASSFGDYPELSSELVAGASTSGVVVFPKLRPDAGLDLHLEVHSSNSTSLSMGP